MESRRLRYATTGILYYSFIGLGVSLAYLPPGLMQFHKLTGADLSILSLVFTSNYVLSLISSLICGQLFNYVNRHAVITVFLGLMAITVAFLPANASVYYFFILNGFGSICYGGFVTAALVWMIEIWREAAAPFIQAQHFSFALGCVFPPLIFKPYLSEPALELLDPAAGNSTVQVSYNTEELVEQARAKLTVPCQICGGIIAVGAVLLAFLFCVLRSDKPQSSRNSIDISKTRSSDTENLEEEDPDQNTASASVDTNANIKPEISLRAKIVLTLLACIFLGAFQGMEVSFIQFLPTYVHYSDLTLNDGDGAGILSAYTIAYTCSRLCGIFLSFKLKSQHILCINFVLIAGANVLFIFKGGSWTLLMAGSILAGIGFSTGYPSFFEYFKNMVEVTNSIGSILVVGGGAIAATYIAAVGRLIQYNPMILSYMNLVGLGVCVSTLAIVVLFKRPLMHM